MKKIITLLLSLCIFSTLIVAQNTIKKETFIYASKEGKDLLLDKYNKEDTITNKPCVIFMFGGGFVNGERDNKRYLSYFNSLAENGNVVLSIDYRKGFSKLKSASVAKTNEQDFVKLFVHTLTIATEDLMDATDYAIRHAGELGINTKKIIASGSSAGAITALHGEYAIANNLDVAQKLPTDFRYAGIISFAGAIFSVHGDLEWKDKPSPMLLFHGSADKNVPYSAAELGYLGFYGSKYIAKQLDNMEVPYYFYDEEYGDHSLASTPMHEHLDIINSFIKNEVIKHKDQRIHTIVKTNGRPSVNTLFSISDYITANFANKR